MSKPLTVWVVADLSTEQGRDLLRNAITFAVSRHIYDVDDVW